ncbi:MAG: hypothetical protein LRZ99_05260 [Desulfotomaculum sp.]|nr:hypothetical protein [Desulfotomaculum sp.]
MDTKNNSLFDNQKEVNQPVTCLGKKFANDQERRAFVYYIDILNNIIKEI